MLLAFSSIVFLNILSPIYVQGDQLKVIDNLRNNLSNVWNNNWNNWTEEARTNNKWNTLFSYEKSLPPKKRDWDQFGESTIRFAIESDTMMETIHNTLSKSLSVVRVLDTNQQKMSTEMGKILEISQSTSSVVENINQKVHTLLSKNTTAEKCPNLDSGFHSNQIGRIMESKFREIVIMFCALTSVLLIVMMIGFLVLLHRISLLSNPEKINQVRVDSVRTVSSRIPVNTDSEEPNHVPLNHIDDNVYTCITNE